MELTIKCVSDEMQKQFTKWTAGFSDEQMTKAIMLQEYLRAFCADDSYGGTHRLVPTTKIQDELMEMGTFDPQFINTFLRYIGYRMKRSAEGALGWEMWQVPEEIMRSNEDFS